MSGGCGGCDAGGAAAGARGASATTSRMRGAGRSEGGEDASAWRAALVLWCSGRGVSRGGGSGATGGVSSGSKGATGGFFSAALTGVEPAARTMRGPAAIPELVAAGAPPAVACARGTGQAVKVRKAQQGERKGEGCVRRATAQQHTSFGGERWARAGDGHGLIGLGSRSGARLRRSLLSSGAASLTESRQKVGRKRRAALGS